MKNPFTGSNIYLPQSVKKPVTSVNSKVINNFANLDEIVDKFVKRRVSNFPFRCNLLKIKVKIIM